jgi:hypothetical protein
MKNLLFGLQICKACIPVAVCWLSCIRFDSPVSWDSISVFLYVYVWVWHFLSKHSTLILSIKSLVDQSSVAKFWIICLLETLSSWYCCTTICISCMCHTEIHIALKYIALRWNTLLSNCNWEQTANGTDNWCPLLSIKNTASWTLLLIVKYSAIKLSTELIISFNSRRGHQAYWFIDKIYICLIVSGEMVALKYRTMN